MNKSSLFVILTILMETLFIAVFNQKLLISNDLQSLKSYLPFANVVAVVLAVLALFSIKEMEGKTRRETEMQVLKSNLAQVEDLLNSLQLQKHEHTRHIQTLQAMLYLGEIEKATEYIEGISESYWHEVDIVQVGHPAVTALLNSKKQVAQSRGVEFDFSVKCNLAGMRISAWDFCSILGNLVDNALEAVITEPDNKVVTVEIKAEEDFFVIYVYNTGPRMTKLQKNNLFKPGYTTKKSDGRGYGLYVVKKLVDSYGGTIEVISDRRTTFIIYLPKSGGMKIDKKSVSACS
jgi:two-component system sensor histidine kinase AgrC